ncbi:agouti-signaling protein-like isoform X2 [Plectropomus leopardus]|uniref:agouti-signaling protein-like isoform X2 n=1 Tax=Plectropomus leopardus TaxID=160734 RepID=UPI001C4CC940|nr:agouti-signaling protein-like isoform X2 [Plectropomus leopardus]
MKLVIMCLCIVHLSLASAGLSVRNDLQTAHNNVTVSWRKASQSTESLNLGRQRSLFARRGQYERQRIHAQKPKVPVPPKVGPPPSKVAPKPAKLKCSQLSQSCVPQSGCCDPRVSCHCRFFNTICFCRRIKS